MSGRQTALRRPSTEAAYSTQFQWQVITGGHEIGLPVWLAGARNAKDAERACDSGFGGGDVLLAQHLQRGFDRNIVCGDESDGGGGNGRPASLSTAPRPGVRPA